MIDFGYDISDFYSIQDEYGKMEDVIDLFQKAKELDIKIILDVVPNHSSDQCEWFLKSVANDTEYRDYYIWHEGIDDGMGGRKEPNNWVRYVNMKHYTQKLFSDLRKLYLYYRSLYFMDLHGPGTIKGKHITFINLIGPSRT